MDNSHISVFSLAPIRELLSRCCYRNELKRNIMHGQLGRMLARKGIDLQYYLYSQPATEVVKHLHNCEHCHSLEQCDAYLQKEALDNTTEPPFCRNIGPLMNIKCQQESLYVSKEPDGIPAK